MVSFKAVDAPMLSRQQSIILPRLMLFLQILYSIAYTSCYFQCAHSAHKSSKFVGSSFGGAHGVLFIAVPPLMALTPRQNKSLCIWQFEMHFLQWQFLSCESNITASGSWRSTWHYVILHWSMQFNGLAPNRLQVIIWSNEDQVQWHIICTHGPQWVNIGCCCRLSHD